MATSANTNLTSRVHNLIILDESGSMCAIYNAALSGVNETLQTIRQAQEENPGQQHFVTLATFDTGHYNEVYKNTPAAQTSDLSTDQYQPCGGTPLYDAIGRGVNQLRPAVLPGDIALVTIITDGYENASREFNAHTIKALIDSLSNSGWVFTYIGANQDVNAVADSLSIKHRMEFKADAEGTHAMFAEEKASRIRFCKSMADGASFDELNANYFSK